MKALERAAELYSMTRDPKITVVYVLKDHMNDFPLGYSNVNYPVVPSVDGGIYNSQIMAHGEEVYQNPQKTVTYDHSIDVMDHARLFLNQHGVPAVFESLSGTPSHDLCDFAVDHDVDLIIVGHSGKGTLKKLLTGSVSESVMKRAEMDVLVVK